MHDSRSVRRARRTCLGIIALMVLVALTVTVLTACGGSGVTGTYAFESGGDWNVSQFKLTLNDDESFELAGPNIIGGEKISMRGTYTLDGDKISLKDDEGKDSKVGTVDDDKLVFEDVTWVKE